MAATYFAIADVQAELKGFVFSTDTTPTAAQVTQWMAEIQGEMDARIGARYETPVAVSGAAAASADLLRGIALALITPRIKGVTSLKTQAPEANQAKAEPTGAAWARAMLKDIQEGKIALSGATLRKSDGGVASPATSLVNPHQFRRTVDGGEPNW